MKILRSGPFPRKSSGACLFLLGLLGLSSAVLFNRKTTSTLHFDIHAKVHTLHSFVATEQSLHGNQIRLSAADPWRHFSVYLSFTKLGQPSFFHAFQFSSVLRMCCQRWYFTNSSLNSSFFKNQPPKTDEMCVEVLFESLYSLRVAYLDHGGKFVSIRGRFSQQLEEQNRLTRPSLLDTNTVVRTP